MRESLSQFHFDQDAVFELTQKVSPDYFSAGGKFRTQLLEQFAAEFGHNIYQMAPYARVIELVHNATLLHDDVIDKSDYRRGVKTMAAEVGNKAAILTGDYMLAKALSELSMFAPNRLVHELSLTLKDLGEGELIQAELHGPNSWTEQIYLDVAKKKTGSIFRWCFLVPLVLQERDQAFMDNYREVALKLGVLYQIIDDLKDFSSLSNKTVMLDLQNENINYVLIDLAKRKPMIFDSLIGNKKNYLGAREVKTLLGDSIQNAMKKAQNTHKEIAQTIESTLGPAKFLEYLNLKIKTSLESTHENLKDEEKLII